LEKGLQWETTWLDLPSGEHKKPEYLAINPVGKVPALIDGQVIVHDSTIINEYLDDRFPGRPLLPRDPAARARARSMEDYADAYMAPSMYKILYQMRKPEAERDRAKIEEGERETRRHFEHLDRELAGREFLAGEFSVADIAYMPHLSSYERAGYKVPADLKNLHAWWERLKARPSYAQSWPG
jgi:glutathione S-transferase